MNELNNRFLSELFDQKQVRCHQDLYQKLFHQIWPCEWYFREFLSCSVTDLKIDYAKKIYAYLRAFEDVVLPEFAITNVISLQLHRLVTSNKAYIPQDHVIHSINLYITGVYLFFNFPLFHKRVLAQDSLGKTLNIKVKSFIRKWKIFSLYHDVGYYFESNIDGEGNVPREAIPTLSEYRKTYTHAIHEKAGRSYSIEEGVPHDMLTYYAHTYHQVLSDFSKSGIQEGAIQESRLPDYLEMLHIMRVDKDNKIEIEIFRHNNENFEIELFSQIKKLAANLHIDFDKLTTYVTNYTRSDHGLISAGLMFQAVAFSHYFAEYCEKHSDLKLAWYGLSGYASLRSGACIADYAEVIFSILLHNVYTYDSSPSYGIDYRHSIDEDAFSYFCAFCDTFQKWHRPKQIDYAKTGLPQKHFLGDKFDLLVTEDRICLKCNLQDAAHVRNSLRDENIYLPGIMHFVQVMER